jgi:hypothetical protein
MKNHEEKTINSNALVVGKEYNLKYYGKARFVGMRYTDSGYLWDFTATENTSMTFSGKPFCVQYSALGLKLS